MTSKSLMSSTSRFGAIYQMQQSLAEDLSNATARNHAKVDVTVGSKNYSVDNYVLVQYNARLLQNKHTYGLEKNIQSSPQNTRKRC